MGTYYLYDVDLSIDMNVFARKHMVKGLKEPIFKLGGYQFNPSYDIDDKNFQKIKDDALLSTVLRKATGPIYDRMMLELEALIRDCCAAWNVNLSKEDNKIDALWSDIEKHLITNGEAMQNKAQPLLSKYMEDRNLGKAARAKYKTKQLKGIAKVFAGVAGTGVAIAAAAASHGATTPGVFVALYGTYKAVKETSDAFRAEAKTIEEFDASLRKTRDTLNEKYLKLPKDEQKFWIAVGEVKAKAANEFLKLKTQSLKKMEEDIKHYERHIDMAFLAASKQGTAVGAMEKCLQEYAKTISQMSQTAVELPEGEKRTKIMEKIKKAREKGAQVMAEIPKLLNAAVEDREEVDKLRKTWLPAYKDYAKDLKDKRPGWVAKASLPMKAVPLVLSAAGGNYHEMAMGAADAVNPAVELGTEAFKELTLLIDENKKNLKGKK